MPSGRLQDLDVLSFRLTGVRGGIKITARVASRRVDIGDKEKFLAPQRIGRRGDLEMLDIKIV